VRRLWKRLVRLAGQSQISLPRVALKAIDIQPGDWIQIESRIWRVQRCSHERCGIAVELVSPRGNALLKEVGSSWILCDSVELVVPADSIIFFSSVFEPIRAGTPRVKATQQERKGKTQQSSKRTKQGGAKCVTQTSSRTITTETTF
jgi:hypothetical protein